MTFLGNVGKADEFSELQDFDWMCDFAFGVDVLSHLNKLNVKNAFVHELYSHVTAFKAKLILFPRNLSNKCFTHFPPLAALNVPPCHTDRCSTTLTLHTEFNLHFSDFEKIEPELVSTPFSFDSEKASPDVQLDLSDIQCDLTLKEKFNTSKLDSFYGYGSLNETQFPNLRRHARRMLVVFGSTYVWEQTFSVMNYNKSRCRSRLTDNICPLCCALQHHK